MSGGTGLRRKELESLKGKDLLTREQIETEISRISSSGRFLLWSKRPKKRNIMLNRSPNKRKAKSRIETAEAAAGQKVAELEKALAAEQKESELQRGINANLLQVAREGASAEIGS